MLDVITRKEVKLVWLSVPSPSLSRLYVAMSSQGKGLYGFGCPFLVLHSVGSMLDVITRKEVKLVWLSIPSPSLSRLYVGCHHKERGLNWFGCLSLVPHSVGSM